MAWCNQATNHYLNLGQILCRHMVSLGSNKLTDRPAYRIWICNYIYVKQCNAINHPCSSFNGGSVEPLWKFGHG